MPGVGGGPAGDALVEVHIEPHPFFERRGNNVHVELPVTLQEALLGSTVTVPTVHGSVSMKIPPGSNSGTTLRLKGKGIPALEGDEIDRKIVVYGKSWSVRFFLGRQRFLTKTTYFLQLFLIFFSIFYFFYTSFSYIYINI